MALSSGRTRWSQPQRTLSWLLILLGIWARAWVHDGAELAATASSLPETQDTAELPNAGRGLVLMGFLLVAALGVPPFLGALRRIRTGRWQTALAEPDARHGYYLEAVALWLILGIPLSAVYAKVSAWTPVSPWSAEILLQALGASVLLWPLWRGVTWAMLCADLGLHKGDGVLRELGAGIIGYMAKLPLTLTAVLATVLLTDLAVGESSPTVPVHPALLAWSIAGRERWAIAVLAIVSAPLVEEVVFRGLLFRYARSSSVRFSQLARVIPSALMTGAAFAVLHPQGVLAIPALLAEGFAFAMIRDWRGSLIAPVVAHSLQNGLIILLFITG
jgi:membrane protease YdiL (CAAX protease family)